MLSVCAVKDSHCSVKPTFLRDETLASRGQPNHDHTYPRIFDLHANAISLCV